MRKGRPPGTTEAFLFFFRSTFEDLSRDPPLARIQRQDGSTDDELRAVLTPSLPVEPKSVSRLSSQSPYTTKGSPD